MKIIRGLSLIMGQQAELYIYEIQQSVYKINYHIVRLHREFKKKCPKQRRKLF